METDFDRIVDRATGLRLTIPELIEMVPGMSSMRYWRAKTGRLGKSATIRALRQVEAKLDQLEMERAT